MIQYVKANKVSYCIASKVDQVAHNRADDVSIHLALQQCGVMIISATENIDERPSGMLPHRSMSSIAEFYSHNLTIEVAKGMNQKAICGGTNGMALIGYLNVRTRDELGRELHTIELDPERTPMIEWAFKAYTSGDCSINQLYGELTTRGRRSLPTPKRPAKPLAVSTVHRLLTNPYYRGDHPPLIAAKVWHQVQSALSAHQSAVEATQVHGNVYCYFVCSGRHSKRADGSRQAMLIEDVEKLVEDYSKRIHITLVQQDARTGMLHHEFDRRMAAQTDELARLTANRDRLEGEQDRLMQAHYADARAHLDDTLGLLANCAGISTRCDDTNRRLRTRPSSLRSTSMRTTNCAANTAGPSKCCSTCRSTATR